jgi:hypothetical protein
MSRSKLRAAIASARQTIQRAEQRFALSQSRWIYFFAYWGIAVLFVAAPIVDMILRQPRVLYLGAWDWRTMVLLIGSAFIIVPALFGLAGLLLGRISSLIAAGGFCFLIVFFAFSLNSELRFRPLLTVAALVGLALLPLAKWLLRFAAVLPALSFGLLVYFVGAVQWAQSGSDYRQLAGQTISAASRTPVFLLTFEKLSWTYFLNDRSQFDRANFKNLASFVDVADLYTDFHSASVSTSLGLRALYSGRAPLDFEVERPNIANALQDTHRIYMINDLQLSVCNPERHACITTIGKISDSRRAHLVLGIWKTWIQTAFVPAMAEYFIAAEWKFDPFADMWAEELTQVPAPASAKPSEHTAGRSEMFSRLGNRQLDYLMQAVTESQHVPAVYVLHSFMSDGIVHCTDDPKLLKDRMCYSRLHADASTFRRTIQRHKVYLQPFDGAVGRFIDFLKSIDLYDKSLIIITADTAFSPDWPAFNDMPSFPHVPENSNVFFAMKRPGQTAGRVIGNTFSQIDVLPTILHTLGVDVSRLGFDGQLMGPDVQPKAPLRFVNGSSRGYTEFQREGAEWRLINSR